MKIGRNNMKIVGGLLDKNFDLFFEPNDPITTPREFTDELLAWASRDGHDITILSESEELEPTIELDGVQYICRLGNPRGASRVSSSSFHLPCITYPLEFKWVFLYKRVVASTQD